MFHAKVTPSPYASLPTVLFLVINASHLVKVKNFQDYLLNLYHLFPACYSFSSSWSYYCSPRLLQWPAIQAHYLWSCTFLIQYSNYASLKRSKYRSDFHIIVKVLIVPCTISGLKQLLNKVCI